MVRRMSSPYMIFLRNAGRFSDAELLERLGHGTYRLAEMSFPYMGRYTYIANASLAAADDWTLIADDFFYTLWNNPSTRPAIASLGAICDAFACSIGDCDDSFDFEYYRDSQLARRYSAVALGHGERQVFEDVGGPLPGEVQAFRQPHVFGIIAAVAHSLGIKTEFTDAEVRFYAPTNRKE